MKLNRIADKAKQAIDKRGGMDALKEDLQEVKQAASGRGSLKDKARAAADALKTPGRNEPEPPQGERPAAPPQGERPATPPQGDRPPEPPRAA